MRLLLLEDNAPLAEPIAAHLRSQGFSVDAFALLREAESALAAESFDLALVDLGLPDGDGLDMLRSLRRRGSRLPVIIVTARDKVRDRILGLDAGADDYLVKPFDLDEMLARLHAVLRRSEGHPSPVRRFGPLTVDTVAHRAMLGGVDAGLTSKEWALLEKLCSRPGAIFTRPQLEQSLYGFDDEVGSNTLEVYVSRVRKKLGRESIETVRGLGYRLGYA